jgi:hypothetical protein
MEETVSGFVSGADALRRARDGGRRDAAPVASRAPDDARSTERRTCMTGMSMTVFIPLMPRTVVSVMVPGKSTDRSPRERKDRTRSVRVTRAARAASARLSVRRGGARGEVSLARRGRGGRRKSAQMTGVGAYATGLSWRVRRERCCTRNLAVSVFAHTKLEACSVTASIRRSTPTHRRQTRRRLGALAPPRHSHRAEPPKGLNVRPPRPASFRAMRRLGASTPLRASESRAIRRSSRASLGQSVADDISTSCLADGRRRAATTPRSRASPRFARPRRVSRRSRDAAELTFGTPPAATR